MRERGTLGDLCSICINSHPLSMSKDERGGARPPNLVRCTLYVVRRSHGYCSATYVTYCSVRPSGNVTENVTRCRYVLPEPFSRCTVVVYPSYKP